MMKSVIEEAIRTVEKAFDEPDTVDLNETIHKLQAAKEQYGDKGTMIEDAITALIQAQHSMEHMETAEDFAPSGAFGQAHNALEQCMKSFMKIDNDPV